MNSQDLDQWFELLRGKIESLKFGTIQITIHNAQIVQIDVTQKLRRDDAPFKAARPLET